MKTDKQIILAREVAKLQERVMTKTSALVHSRRRNCEEELQRRWEQAVPDSATLVSNLSKATATVIDSSVSEVGVRAQAYAQDLVRRLRATVESRISLASHKGEFKKDVPLYIQDTVSSGTQKLGNWLTRTKEDLFSTIVDGIDSEFDRLFSNVKNINLKLMMRDSLLYWLTTVFAVASASVSWFQWRSNGIAAWSAVAGAFVGYLVFYMVFRSRIKRRYWIEPVSSASIDRYVIDRLAVDGGSSTALEAAKNGLKPTLLYGTIGLLSSGGDPTILLAGLGITALLSIGGAIWDKFFGPSLEQVKESMREKVAPVLDKFESEVHATVSSEMQTLELSLRGFCEDRIRQLDRRYESIIMELATRDRAVIADWEARVSVLAEIESELAERSAHISRGLSLTREMLARTS